MIQRKVGTAISQQYLSDASGAKREALAALGELHGVFQPIVSVAQREIIAYEGLIRGPSSLHMPAALFAAAKSGGCSDELEYRAGEVIVQAYAAAARPGLLFVNFSAQAVIHLGSKGGCRQLLQTLDQCALPAKKLVIEITEHERVVDHAGMMAAVRRLRAMGVGIALDDFGDGGSSLRLWAEIEPEFVKIDRYFCHDIHCDGRKVQTVKAMLRLAENFGSRIVAEGTRHRRLSSSKARVQQSLPDRGAARQPGAGPVQVDEQSKAAGDLSGGRESAGSGGAA
jgi:EAL domain-containing protein (putative c-di-GMP-specific phosphodiesterase class I)